jgi:uncharacterized protein with HEPN domain
MSRGDDLRRQDIVDACGELALIEKARIDGTTDERVLIRAAERLLEIIGEAANKCSTEFRIRHPEVDWEGLTGLRIVLAHLYHRSDPRLIWHFVEYDAPSLAESLRSDR